jgi:hypothetical protein
MTQRTSVPSRPPSALVSSNVVQSRVALSSVASTSVASFPVAPSMSVSFPPDIVRLLEVFARIELRRQLRLRELQEREAS